MEQDPYRFPPGEELDRVVHERIFHSASVTDILPYSTEQRAADKVKSRLKEMYGLPVSVGSTRLKSKPFFARLESGPSTSTEVLAESCPLAICRLALVVHAHRNMK